MAFGMNFQSMEELANGLHYLERSFFAQGEQNKYIHALFNYTKEFIAILYGASNQQPTQQQQSYYLFDIPVLFDLSRLILLSRGLSFSNSSRCSSTRKPKAQPSSPKTIPNTSISLFVRPFCIRASDAGSRLASTQGYGKREGKRPP